jgi:predicted AlkP superfamily phosphohydrolase/phosphomutase
MGPLNLVDLRRRLLNAVVSRAKSVHWLMAQAPWDLFLVVFGETHPAAHYGWPLPNPSATVSPTESSHTLLRDVYEAVDRAIGEILQHVDEEVTIFIVSGDGVGPNYAGWHLLPEVLQRLGFTAALDRALSEDSTESEQGRRKTDSLKKLRDLVPANLRQAISRCLPDRWRDSLMSRWATANIDWPRTRAFCLPTDLEGCIRINLRGREPEGIVQQGAEYEEVCRSLSTALQQLINPLTGRPAVRQVIYADEVLPGERRHNLPDLIVLWSEEAELKEVYSPKFGVVKTPSPDARTGTHRPPGFILARGPRVQRSHLLEGGHIADFAPTVLAQFGLPSPQYMDGHAWSNL